jgi:hypothetical protein
MPRLYPESSDLGLPRYSNLNIFGGSPIQEGTRSTPWVVAIRDPSPDQRNVFGYIWTYSARWTSGFVQSENTGRPVGSSLFLADRWSFEIVADITTVCNSRERMTESSDIPPALLEGIGPGEFCVVRLPGSGVGMVDYFIAPLGNFGDDYFFATAADGRVVEGIRLLYR